MCDGGGTNFGHFFPYFLLTFLTGFRGFFKNENPFYPIISFSGGLLHQKTKKNQFQLVMACDVRGLKKLGTILPLE